MPGFLTSRDPGVRKVILGAAVLATSVVVGVTGYCLAGWPILESVYMVVITLFGIGYGEVEPVDSPGLRLFTIGFILVGCTSAIYTLGAIIQMITEGEVNRLLGNRRMHRDIEKLAGHVIVCGYGRVGQILSGELTDSRIPFVVVDADRGRCDLAEAAGRLVICGDATSESVLATARTDKARSLVTCLPDDALNVFITLTAREIAPDVEIIARAEKESTRNKLMRSGADNVISPAEIGATRMARLITHPTAEALLCDDSETGQLNSELSEFGLTMREIVIPPGSAACGMVLADVDFAGSRGLLVVAIRGGEGEVHACPNGATMLCGGDTLIVMGHQDDLPKVERQLRGTSGPDVRVANAPSGRVDDRPHDADEAAGRSPDGRSVTAASGKR